MYGTSGCQPDAAVLILGGVFVRPETTLKSSTREVYGGWMRTCMLMACLLALPRVGWCQEDTLQGLWKPVDLQLDRVETRQAFERLFAASGVRVQIPPENSDKRITVGLKKATFWQGLDEICRADGGVSYPERIYQSN